MEAGAAKIAQYAEIGDFVAVQLVNKAAPFLIGRVVGLMQCP